MPWAWFETPSFQHRQIREHRVPAGLPLVGSRPRGAREQSLITPSGSLVAGFRLGSEPETQTLGRDPLGADPSAKPWSERYSRLGSPIPWFGPPRPWPRLEARPSGTVR